MRTRTPAQIEASRNNGAKSKGPVTGEGKVRSSQNALKHGLSAHKIVVLENESKDEWEAFHASFIAKFRPRDFVESQLVLEMAVNRWRLQRSWAMQTAAIDVETAREREYVPDGYEDWDNVQVTAYSHNSRREQLDALSQMETRLTRNFDRALRNLTQLRKQQAFLENEPGKYNSEIDRPAQTPEAPRPVAARRQPSVEWESDRNGVRPEAGAPAAPWRNHPQPAASDTEVRTQ
jgi:hypothetical protein